MKRVLLYTMAAFLVLASCSKKDDPVFDESPDVRLNKVLAEYQAALAGAPNGWNAELRTANGSLYHFHFGFNDANRVQMYADFDTLTASVRKESSFRLKALQQPALLFDTYSYVHILADPDATVNGGEFGLGLSSDFEFSLDTLAADSIKLTGRFNGSKMILRKASAQDLQAWQNGQWKNALLFESISALILNYFKRLNVGGKAYEISLNAARREITFTWRDGGGIPRQHTTTYSFSGNNVQLDTPLTDGGTTISTLSNLSWNAGTSSFQVNVNGTQAASIAGAIAPMIPDLNAPTRWWQYMADREYFWTSFFGFHVNGVDDAFKIRSIPGLYALVFVPRFGSEQGVIYDLAAFTSVSGSNLNLLFGAAFRPPVFTTDGRVIFRYFGTLGDVPPEHEEKYINTASLLNSTSGFYLVQTSETSYDMVSATDAKAWITWLR
ncbi:DUF4302 domain-containing protein [Chitinophaga sp.]|uniref:DUF4302 domain-containing protein n=1 Tax=Chitinophaga sp. TaxID=1869181 RepID=UPI0031D25B6A